MLGVGKPQAAFHTSHTKDDDDDDDDDDNGGGGGGGEARSLFQNNYAFFYARSPTSALSFCRNIAGVRFASQPFFPFTYLPAACRTAEKRIRANARFTRGISIRKVSPLGVFPFVAADLSAAIRRFPYL